MIRPVGATCPPLGHASVFSGIHGVTASQPEFEGNTIPVSIESNRQTQVVKIVEVPPNVQLQKNRGRNGGIGRLRNNRRHLPGTRTWLDIKSPQTGRGPANHGKHPHSRSTLSAIAFLWEHRSSQTLPRTTATHRLRSADDLQDDSITVTLGGRTRFSPNDLI